MLVNDMLGLRLIAWLVRFIALALVNWLVRWLLVNNLVLRLVVIITMRERVWMFRGLSGLCNSHESEGAAECLHVSKEVFLKKLNYKKRRIRILNTYDKCNFR